MSIYYLYQDDKKCFSCRACQVQCKVNKGLGPGAKPNQVVEVGPVKTDDKPKASYIFMSCFHCEEPWCLPACPTGAIQKRPGDGVVFIDQEECVGCKNCITACPWGSPQWDAQKGVAVKCDYCLERIDRGIKPACVTACPAECLSFVPSDQIPDIKRVRYVKEVFAGRVR